MRQYNEDSEIKSEVLLLHIFSLSTFTVIIKTHF